MRSHKDEELTEIYRQNRIEEDEFERFKKKFYIVLIVLAVLIFFAAAVLYVYCLTRTMRGYFEKHPNTEWESTDPYIHILVDGNGKATSYMEIDGELVLIGFGSIGHTYSPGLFASSTSLNKNTFCNSVKLFMCFLNVLPFAFGYPYSIIADFRKNHIANVKMVLATMQKTQISINFHNAASKLSAESLLISSILNSIISESSVTPSISYIYCRLTLLLHFRCSVLQIEP